MIASLKPFTPKQLTTIRTLGAQRGPGVAYAPGSPSLLEWKQLAAENPETFCSTYRYNVCAPTDDKPFFFNMKRLSQIGESLPAVYSYTIDPYMVLGITLGLLMILCGSHLEYLWRWSGGVPDPQRPPCCSSWQSGSVTWAWRSS